MKRSKQPFCGPPKPPARVIAERIISILEMPWREPGTEYFYISDEQLTMDEETALFRIGISRTDFSLPSVSALTQEIESLLASSPDLNFEAAILRDQYENQ